MNLLKEENRESNKEIKEENQQQQHVRVRAYSRAWDLGFNTRLLEAAAKKIGMSRDELDGWIIFMDQVDWLFTNGKAITPNNFLRSLRMWHKMEPKLREKVRRIKQPEFDYEAQERRAEAKRKALSLMPGAWELCDERCANFSGARCPHYNIPPQLRERPVPPEECPGYSRKEA